MSNQPTNQPTNQSASQPINRQPFNHQPINHQPVNQPTSDQPNQTRQPTDSTPWSPIKAPVPRGREPPWLVTPCAWDHTGTPQGEEGRACGSLLPLPHEPLPWAHPNRSPSPGVKCNRSQGGLTVLLANHGTGAGDGSPHTGRGVRSEGALLGSAPCTHCRAPTVPGQPQPRARESAGGEGGAELCQEGSPGARAAPCQGPPGQESDQGFCFKLHLRLQQGASS